MAHPKFARKNTPSHGPIPNTWWPASSLDLSDLWCQMASDPICRLPQCTGQADRPTHVHTYRPTDRPRESLMTIGRCATRATRPNNTSLRLKDNHFSRYDHPRQFLFAGSGAAWSQRTGSESTSLEIDVFV